MNNNNESNVKFRDLFRLFVSNLWIMILVAVVVGTSIFVYNYATYEPQYKSTGSIYILRQGESKEDVDYSSDFNVALSVVNDCKKLLTSHTVLDKVIKDNDLNYTYEELNSIITINNPSSTRYLEVSVVTDSPKKSKLIVDSICEVGEVAIDDLMGFDQVNKFDQGTLEDVPCNSKFSYTIILGALAAFLLTYIVIALAFIFDDRITDPELLEDYLGLSVLAIIPNINKDKSQKNSNQLGRTGKKRQRYYAQNWKENK